MCNYNGVFIALGARYCTVYNSERFECSYLGVNIEKTKVLPVGYNKPLHQLFSDHSKQPLHGLGRLRTRISSCFVLLIVPYHIRLMIKLHS